MKMNNACFFIVAIYCNSFYSCKSQPAFGENNLKLDKVISMPEVCGRIDHLTVDEAHQIMYVAALGNSSVEVIDLSAGKVVHPDSKSFNNPLNAIPKANHLTINQAGCDSLPKRNNKNITSTNTIAHYKKIYCCLYYKTKYEIIRSGNRITLTSSYEGLRSTVHGIIKNGKVYTDDPDEKLFKSQAGKIYLFDGTTLRIKNLENGDYDDYTECNK